MSKSGIRNGHGITPPAPNTCLISHDSNTDPSPNTVADGGVDEDEDNGADTAMMDLRKDDCCVDGEVYDQNWYVLLIRLLLEYPNSKNVAGGCVCYDDVNIEEEDGSVTNLTDEYLPMVKAGMINYMDIALPSVCDMCVGYMYEKCTTFLVVLHKCTSFLALALA